MSSNAKIVMEFYRNELELELAQEGNELQKFLIPVLFPQEEDQDQYHFGTVNVTTEKTEMVSTRQDIMFSVDISGSMSDRCADGNTKLGQVINTITNILMLACESNENGSQIFIQVDAFDDQIEKIVEMQKVSKDNVLILIEKIHKMKPRNTTNIEAALKNASEVLSQYSTPTHIFLTDGNATTGCSNKNTLKEFIDPRYRNVIIGYGRDHSAELLLKLSETKNSRYLFIDKIENSGYAFGEIIHEILYVAFKNCILNTTNAELYEYETNTWTTSLNIGLLTGEANKTFHVRSRKPDEATAQLLEEEQELDNTLAISKLEEETQKIQNLSLVKYIFRQKVLEVMFNARIKQNEQNEQKYNIFSMEDDLSCQQGFGCDFTEPIITTSQNIKELMKNTMKNIKDYMKEQNMEETHVDYPFFKTLIDDLYITYRTYGTDYGAMYSTSRANSQGRQQSYNVSELPIDNYLEPPKLQRNNAFTRCVQSSNSVMPLTPPIRRQKNAEQYENEDDEEEHIIISTVPLNRAYTSSTVEKVMRSVSSHIKTPSI
jgi:hypothetical protein